MQEIILRHIDNKVNEIRNKYNIIKDINFNTDIDNIKTGNSFYNLDNNELTFFYGNKKYLFDCLFNDMFSNETLSETLTPNIPLKLNENKYFFCFYSSAYQLSEEEILHFKYTKSDILDLMKNIYYFSVSLSDDVFNKLDTNFMKKSYNDNNFVDFSSLKHRKGLLNAFNIINNTSVSTESIINNYTGEPSNSNIFTKKLSLKDENNYILNRIDKSVFYNNIFDTIQTGQPLTHLKNLSISVWSHAQSTLQLNKENFIIGSKNGYIYFNDIVIPDDVKKLKVILISQGNINLEVFLHDKWININSLELENISVLKLRLCMEYGAKVKNLMIAKAN